VFCVIRKILIVRKTVIPPTRFKAAVYINGNYVGYQQLHDAIHRMKSNIIDIDTRGSFVAITFGNQEARDQFVAKKFLSLKKIELPIKIFPPPPQNWG